jgi:hypothetical protein
MSRPTGVTGSALLMMFFIAAGLVLSYNSGNSANGTVLSTPSISVATVHSFIWISSAITTTIVYFYWSAHDWAEFLY